MRPDGIVHADMAGGKFPVLSRRGYQYLLICVCEGYIHFELMKSRTADAYLLAYSSMISFFKCMGRHLTFARLDNETSTKLEIFLNAKGITPQHVPPGTH